MYLAELETKDTTEGITFASFLHLILSIWRDGQLHTSIYDNRDDFNFYITNFPFMSIIPFSLSYDVFISQLFTIRTDLLLVWMLILRARRLSSKLIKQRYLVEHLKSSVSKFYGRYGDLIQQYEVSLSRILNGTLTLDQQWLPNRSDIPPISWPWYQVDFNSPNKVWLPSIICKRVWHASKERLSLRTPGSVTLFVTCLRSNCRKQFSWTYRGFSRLFTTGLFCSMLDIVTEEGQWSLRGSR